jgi:4-hydroxy-tetrahydrodipicolinate reductase
LRKKVGAGLSPAEFAAGVQSGALGHVGLAESVALLARGLGFTLDTIEETVDPVISLSNSPREGVEIGQVAGVHQVALGKARGEPLVKLDLEMSVAAPDPHDRIQITGDPPLDLQVHGGTQGDRGTVGATINAIPHLISGPSGLLTVADLPLFGLLS